MTRTMKPCDMPSSEQIGPSGFGALETERGLLPLTEVEVRTSISGLIAETRLRQTFRNALDEPLEATYIFPLPDRAAVTTFQMRIADRTIDGQLKERGEARKDYDAAIKKGHRAAIAEEERSGTFNLRVGNIPAHETVTLELTMVGPLPVSNGSATFRFPLVVAPRYTPGIPLEGPAVGQGWAPDTDQVPDASRVTPPVLLPGFPNPVQLSMEVQIDPSGLDGEKDNWPGEIQSSLHCTLTDEGPPWTISLLPGERLNKDFILRLPIAQSTIATSLHCTKEEDGKPGTFALTIVPPVVSGETKPRPRDVVFVLDRSGSMGGWKMVAARRAVGRMIDTLLDQDRFSVIAFDTVLENPPHTNGLVSGTNHERWRMLEWVGKIEARGGTEMRNALTSAMNLLSDDPHREKVVVVVTDGQVTGEDALLRQLTAASSGKLPRVFTVGIDRAVNAGFLRRLADVGEGHCELVESEQRLDEAMDSIHRLIGTPALTQLTVEPLDFDWVADSISPSCLPDLFTDRPITIYGRGLSESNSIKLRVRGTDANGNRWHQVVSGTAQANKSLLNLWGRANVRDLEDLYASGRRSDLNSLRQLIVETSLETNVLSRFTAYVAVDKSEIVNQGGVQNEVIQPVEMPEGWDMDDSMDRRSFERAAIAPTMSQSLNFSQSLKCWSEAPTENSKRKTRKAPDKPSVETIDEIAESIRRLIAQLSGILWKPLGLRIHKVLVKKLHLLITMLKSEGHPSAKDWQELASRFKDQVDKGRKASPNEPLSQVLSEITDSLDLLRATKDDPKSREQFWV